jgi:hypothetical protein
MRWHAFPLANIVPIARCKTQDKRQETRDVCKQNMFIRVKHCVSESARPSAAHTVARWLLRCVCAMLCTVYVQSLLEGCGYRVCECVGGGRGGYSSYIYKALSFSFFMILYIFGLLSSHIS